MSDRSPRQSRGGEYDYSRYNKGPSDSRGSPTKKSNMSPGDKISSSTSRSTGATSYHEHHGSHSKSFLQTGYQETGDFQYTSNSERNPTGSRHQLPFHKGFDSTHTTGSLSRPMYNNKAHNRGQLYPKDEFEYEKSHSKLWHGDRGAETGTQSGYNYSNNSQKPSYNFAKSENLTTTSSESNRVNFPPGHPNHNPHLPPPNPFIPHSKSSSSSLSSSQPMPKSSNDKFRTHSRDVDKEVNPYHRDSNRRHEKLPSPTSFKPQDPSIERSHKSNYDHDMKKNSSINDPRFNSPADEKSRHR